MKNYKTVTPFVLVAVLVLGSFMLVNNAVRLNAEYQQLLTTARDDANKGMIQAAADNYTKVLTLHPNSDLGHEIVDFYKNNFDEHAFLKYMQQKYLKIFPTDDYGYNEVASATFDNKEFQKFYSNYDAAMKAGINMQTINDLRSKLKWVVDAPKRLQGAIINNSGFNSDGRAYIASTGIGSSKGSMTLIGRNGDEIANYEKAGAFFEGKAPVFGVIDNIKSEPDNRAFFIDVDNKAVMTSKDIYQEFGALSNNIFPAKNGDGKWIYLDTNYNEISGTDKYDIASSFYNKIAAVGTYINGVSGDNGNNSDSGDKSGDNSNSNSSDDSDKEVKINVSSDIAKLVNVDHNNIDWQIIKTDGSKLIDKTFADVKINNSGMISGSNAFFAKEDSNSKWKMYNSQDGTQIGQNEFDDVYAFNSGDHVLGDTYAAVEKDGKWGFVKSNGEMKIDYKFASAYSFLNGTAPAKDVDKGQWGFVNDNGDYVIEPNYLTATSFNQNGRAIVEISPNRWSIISLVENLYGGK